MELNQWREILLCHAQVVDAASVHAFIKEWHFDDYCQVVHKMLLLHESYCVDIFIKFMLDKILAREFVLQLEQRHVHREIQHAWEIALHECYPEKSAHDATYRTLLEDHVFQYTFQWDSQHRREEDPIVIQVMQSIVPTLDLPPPLDLILEPSTIAEYVLLHQTLFQLRWTSILTARGRHEARKVTSSIETVVFFHQYQFLASIENYFAIQIQQHMTSVESTTTNRSDNDTLERMRLRQEEHIHRIAER